MQVSHSASIGINRAATFGELVAAVSSAEIPHTAVISVEHYEGDQRDPGYTNLNFRWTTGGTS